MSNREFVMEALPEHFVRRMRNWASAQAGSSGAFASGSVWDGFTSSSGFHEAPIPVLRGESDDTDKALQEIPARERQAVMLFWQYENGSFAYLAGRCRVDYRTYAKRVIEGHELLKGVINRMAEAARVARDENDRRTRETLVAREAAQKRARAAVLKIRLTR